MSRNTENKHTVLIVDDEKIIRKICHLTLMKMGYHLLIAENGVEALRLLAKSDCDMALVDLKMPLMGGMELLHNMQRDYPHIQVIMMTAYATVEIAIDAMKRGAYDLILKPFRADQLRIAIERCAKSIELNKEIQELKVSNKKLKEIHEMKDKFIAITSHELRTPVSHIKGYLTIIDDDSANEITASERKEYMSIIKAAVNDLENIVHNMYDVLKLEYGRIELNVEDVALAELIAQVIAEFRFILKERKLFLKCEDIFEPAKISGDRFKLKQVISELLQNAIKYTPDGGSIEIQTARKGDFCHLKVIDTGVGICEAKQSKIFEKFYEIQNSDYHSSSKMEFMGGGIGLGLTIVKDIVEAHHGRVIVQSASNKGSIFTVMLPITFNYEISDDVDRF